MTRNASFCSQSPGCEIGRSAYRKLMPCRSDMTDKFASQPTDGTSISGRDGCEIVAFPEWISRSWKSEDLVGQGVRILSPDSLYRMQVSSRRHVRD